MLQPKKIFANFFDDEAITPLRLSNFTADAIIRFTNANTSGVYTDVISAMVAAQQPFSAGLSGIDTSLGIQKGKTLTVNETRTAFGHFMGEFESEIAHAIGGFGSAAHTAFYPHGVSEYSHATKTQMPLLVQRTYVLANTYATELGKALVAQLQAFATQWQAALDEQSTIKGSVSDGRADRNNIRQNLEIALLAAVHLVAYQFPSDVAKCMGFFDFGLLTGIAHTLPAVPKPSLS